MTADLTKPMFTDETKAREYLESVRWPSGPICPHCGAVENITRLEGKSHRAGLHQCNHCREHFTVTVGTVYESSHIPLHKWLMVTHLMCASKKGISSKQVERMLGITYKSAWFMTHRIRESMKPSGGGLLGSGGGTVEADETFIGRKPGRKKYHGHEHKLAVFSLVERNGNVRSYHVPDVTGKTLKEKLNATVSKKAKLMTDTANQYVKIGKEFASHESVNHAQDEYVRGDVHTNTIEGFFIIFKRGMIGVYQLCSSQHLERYTTEFDFRYSHREKRIKIDGKWTKTGYSDADRTIAALKGISGKRLTYRRAHETA